MKAIVCLALLATLAGCAVAQNATVNATSPSPAVAASPSPAVTPSPAIASPAIEAVPSPTPAVETLTPEPVADNTTAPAATEPAATEPATTVPVAEAPVEAPAANATASPAANATSANGTIAGQNNITNSQVQAYFSSPLFAIQQTPDLAELAKLGQRSAVAALLSDKKLVATIFAPNNDAVNSAVKFIEDATGANRTDLVKQGVVEQLLSYHVTKGAPLLLSKLKNEQVLTMLDGNKTTVTIEAPAGGARRMLLQEGPSFFINSDSNQQIKIVKGNIQGGKSMLHIIDGVLVPKALLDAYSIPTDGLPGVVPGAVAAADTTTSTSKEVTPAAAPKSSATRAVAALLAVPALLAALMF